MCTTNASRSGAGAYCTSRPASSGPAPRPPTLATVATAAARFRQCGGAASMTAAVAVPVKMPADSPDNTRPTSSVGTESAARNTTALARANAVPASSIGRRPIASDQRPNASSANSTPPAYVAKITVVVSTAKCMRSPYSAYIGVGSVVPTMIAANA